MSRIAHSFAIVRRSVQSYSEEPQNWKVEDTEEALRCWDFEKYLEIGIDLFEAITEFDEHYRARVLDGKEEWDEAIAASIQEAYEWWYRPGQQLLRDLCFLEQQYGEIKRADEFRRYVREAEGILSDDAAFFSGDQLVHLCDEAVNLHRKGETFECGTEQ